MGKIICGPCQTIFLREEQYLKHECKAASGAKPTEPEYLKRTTTPNYDAIAKKAKERGASLKKV